MRLIHLALSGALVVLGVALDRMYEGRCRHRVSTMRDESLDATYPASDPPATQDYSAPDERTAVVMRPAPGRLH